MALDRTGYSRAVSYTIIKTTNGSTQAYTYSLLDSIGVNLAISKYDLGILSIGDYITRVNNVKSYTQTIFNDEFISTNYGYSQTDECCPKTISDIISYDLQYLSDCELINDGSSNVSINPETTQPYHTGKSRVYGMVITKTINNVINFVRNYNLYDSTFTNYYYMPLDNNYNLTFEKVLMLNVGHYTLLHSDFITYLNTLSDLNELDIYNNQILTQPIIIENNQTCPVTISYEQICDPTDVNCEQTPIE